MAKENEMEKPVDLSREREVRKALGFAAKALDIASDHGLTNVQVYPPDYWELPAYDEDPEDGWCATNVLADKLRDIAVLV